MLWLQQLQTADLATSENMCH